MMSNIILRDVIEGDLAVFFEQQLVSDANYMAAFTAKDPTDKASFYARFDNVVSDRDIKRSVLVDGQVAGYVMSFEMFGQQQVGYWFGSRFWGKGIATSALKLLLEEVKTRPLYGRAAKDNLGSIRVLEKCGFQMHGEERILPMGEAKRLMR